MSMIFDQSAYVPGWKKSKGKMPWAIDYWAHLDVDYVVMLGPVISRNFLPIWKSTLDTLKKRGIRYMILSSGMMKHNYDDITEIKKYFNENPPYVITTRDRDMYETFKDFVPKIYDGICFAFFVPDYYKPVKTDLGPVMAVNFDKIDEPYIYVDESNKKVDVEFNFEDHHYGMKFKGLASVGLRTDRFTDALIYASSPLPRGKRPAKIGDYTVIRPDHRFCPMFIRKAFRYVNSFCADIPHTYANIYAESKLTLSDRVHACALTLAYGNAAYLFAKTGRSALLTRVGAEGINDHPVKIDLENLAKEKNNLIEWMRNIQY
ncbi:hypothetical protein DEAC_c21680 [Desulfosporosinus acididurans]|uniref:Polysaccharide pyruvyl transferase domain-containing protein n=1 Tax=Desulfosporosinus acididurans TaxID=476652 RepID=A0A0J1FRM5_9FIRM|nr:hypothetical protein DEAC_c21680 [Desulfosporosinus acididurans]